MANRVICDRTGFKVYAKDCKYEWTGALVKKSEWEPRHPQDFVRGVPDGKPAAEIRPDTKPEFVGMYGPVVKPEDL